MRDDKILIIANSQYPDSLEVAEYYVNKRGLNPDHLMDLDLGTASDVVNSATFHSGIITDISNYIVANDIDGIILSTRCPRRYQFQPSPVSGNVYDEWCSYAAIIGVCSAYKAQPSSITEWKTGELLWHGKSWIDAGRYVNNATSDYTCVPHSFNGALDNCIDKNDTLSSLPTGRLGGNYSPATSSITLDDNSIVTPSELAVRCIDDAVWFEQNGDAKTEPMIFGNVDRQPNLWMTGMTVELAYRHLKDSVGLKHIYHNTSSGVGSYDSGHAFIRTTTENIADSTDFLTGVARDKIDVWGWIGLGQTNYNVTSGPNGINNVNFKRGGWMYESTSSPVSLRAVINNACCAVGTTTEPTSLGTSCLYGIAQILKHGGNMMEAVWYSPASQNGTWRLHIREMEIIGDPMYKPFKFIPVKSSGIASIQ